jgi:toxin ParE1/3/4
MERKYSIKVTPKANEDLDDIYDYISRELFNQVAAENLMDKIENCIMRLGSFPFSCSIVKDELCKQKGYRKLIINNYIAFYIVNEEEKQVIIMRVLYGKQNYQDFI